MIYGSECEFLCDMTNSSGVVFADNFGRKWKYQDYKFYHKDLEDKEWSNGLFCLHLFGTNIFKEL